MSQQETKLEGKVKFFNKTKGFGFIVSEGTEYFVHVTGLASPNIKEGDDVEFDIKEGKKGLNCINVTLI